jgi:hypothetical protein
MLSSSSPSCCSILYMWRYTEPRHPTRCFLRCFESRSLRFPALWAAATDSGATLVTSKLPRAGPRRRCHVAQLFIDVSKGCGVADCDWNAVSRGLGWRAKRVFTCSHRGGHGWHYTAGLGHETPVQLIFAMLSPLCTPEHTTFVRS